MLSGNENPDDPRLGFFGFAPSNGASRAFAAVDGAASAVGEPEYIRRYWPSDLGAIVEATLSAYGFEVQAPSGTPGGKPPNCLSVRFGPDKITYRVALAAGAATSTGDLRKDTDGRFKLKLRDEIGGRYVERVQYGASPTDGPGHGPDGGYDILGWLAVGDLLHLDCELSWKLDRSRMWSPDRGRAWNAAVTLRLHWNEDVPKNLPAPAAAGATFTAGLLPLAADNLRQVRRSLVPSEAGLPHSFLPTLSAPPAGSGSGQRVRFSLYGEPIPASIAPSGLVEWDVRAAGQARPPMRLSLARASHLIAGLEDDGLSLKLDAAEMSFFQTAGMGVGLVLDHDETWPPITGAADGSPPFFASFKVATSRVAVAGSAANAPWSGRLSSLAFSGRAGDVPPADDSDGRLRIGGKGDGVDQAATGSVLVYPNGRGAVQLRFRLPATRVDQVAVDTRRDDRSGRPAPLLIPLSDAGSSATGTFWLIATETTTSRQDRWLEAELREDAPETGERRFVVLSNEPFSVLKFSQRPLSDRGDAASASVAIYSGDDRLWQYRRVADHYHYVLPPQAVGESADKPGRLELHDLIRGGLETPRPFVHDVFGGIGKEAGWNLRRRAVEFRLTPSAEIWIRPSDVERGYFMPESTSHEIFRQSGAYGLGAALAYLRAEFLYGLPVGIDVSKETGLSRGARVAEIEALTGRLAGPAGAGAEPAVAQRWNAVRAAVARRPERLEVWARDLDSTTDFTPARFSAGVRFALRGTALHRQPVGPETATDALPEGADASDPTEALRFHPQGLSGGAVWPVESLNLLQVLRRQPGSSGGAIERIALSPTGGDAAQKAEFLGGKVTIISETSGGDIQRQQVEVLGRICAFWHRAKHVVVYERTTNASAQFAPRQEEDPHRTRSRRPILRKVQEYIEVLQPERSYPDDLSAAPRAAGFLEKVRFNAAVINVDSAWASEVGRFGWKVPLWNRLSARERPQVYPMPDTAFVTTGEGAGDRPVVAQECLDLDALFFFADFETKSSDTNTWPSRLGLDYPNMAAAKVLMGLADAASAYPVGEGPEVDGRRRSVSRFLPGLRAFTWRLAPAAQKTAINAGRSGKPVYVGLESVTFMRATQGRNTLPDATLDLLKASTTFSPNPSTAEALGKIKYWAPDNAGSTFPDLDTFNAYFSPDGQLGTALRNGDVPTIKAVTQDLKDKWTGGGLRTALSTHLASLPGGYRKQDFEAFKSQVASGGAVCARLKADAVGTIRRKEMLVRTALGDLVGDGTRLADELIRQATKDNAATWLTGEAIRQIKPFFEEASQDVAGFDEDLEKIRAALRDAEAEMDAVFARAEGRVRAWAASYDRDKPWSPARREAFRAGVEAAIASVAEDVRAAIDETRRRMSIELGDFTQAIGGHVARLLAEIATAQLGSEAFVTRLGATVGRLLGDLDRRLAALAEATGTPLKDKIDALIERVKAEVAEPGPRDAAVAALEGFKTARNAALGALGTAQDKVRAVDQAADTALGDVEDAAAALGDGLKELVQDLGVAVSDVATHANNIAGQAADLAKDIVTLLVDGFDEVFKRVLAVAAPLLQLGDAVDAVVEPTLAWMRAVLETIQAHLRDDVLKRMSTIVDDARSVLDQTMDALKPDSLLETVVRAKIVAPVVNSLLAPLPNDLSATPASSIVPILVQLEERVGGAIQQVSDAALGPIETLTAACQNLAEGVEDTTAYLQGLAGNFGDFVQTKLDGAYGGIVTLLDKVDEYAGRTEEILAAVSAAGHAIRGIQNDLSRAGDSARVYADRVFDGISKLDDGGLLAAPSNVLKLYSAVSSAPEIAALKSDIDRIRAGFDEFAEVIDTTKAGALFNRLGDELKGLGLSLPFDGIGERLLPAMDLSDFDIGKVFRNFGGAKLDRLFEGYKLPAGVRDAIKITHDLDPKQARAWVQVDIDASMPGRRSLFSVGIFQADFVDMRLTGQVRLEASKDQDKVEETGFGRIDGVIDLVVGGQSLVTFTKFGLRYTKQTGLKIDFDPAGIRLNPQFQFIQDFLSTLFGGDPPGGLKIIKEGGLPVGVEHEFVIPPLSLNFGTSGVSNISIENRFRLVAYPDFILADRFNLSTVERPFIFSIFIIGGTGYIQIEAQYRPLDNELSVLVEAGAGGSASLAFAFGPFSGQVFITLSGTLAYRKMIGQPGGGLAISVVLVIAGHVSVAGIVTVGITVMLRMTYRDDGQVDGEGTLSVTIRISRFFSLNARAEVRYKLRGGKAQTQVEAKASSPEIDSIRDVASKLQKARA